MQLIFPVVNEHGLVGLLGSRFISALVSEYVPVLGEDEEVG